MGCTDEQHCCIRSTVALRLSSCAAAFLLLLSLSACGNPQSSSSPPPPATDPADALLSGTYVFGISVCTNLTVFGGQFTADGRGNITAGSLTSNSIVTGVATSGTPLTGSYKMTSDGRGQASLTTSSATIALNFVLISKSHGYVMEFDNNGCGSGTLDLQTTVSQSNLAGSYVVSLVGEYLKDADPMDIAGAFTLDAAGNITAGIQDGVGNPPLIISTYIAQPLSGSLQVGSGNSPGKATFDGILHLSFDVYPIDATHLKLIGTSGEVFVGEAFRQGTALPSGSQVFTLTGSDANFSNMNVGGLMTFDGNGSVIAGLEDLDDSGNLYLSMPFSGSYSALDSNGRTTMTLTGFSPHLQSVGSNTTTQFVLYPYTGGLVILEIDGVAELMGPAFVQTNPSLATDQPFGMFVSGWNGSRFSSTAQFTTGSSGASFSGSIDSNGFALTDGIGSWTRTSGQTLTGTYSFDSATGRGSISSNSFSDLEFYLIDDTSALFIGISGEQQAQGSFAAQTLSGTKSSMLAPRRFSFARMPASRSAGFRAASRKKTPSAQ